MTPTERPAPPKLRIALILGSLSSFGPITTDLYLPGLPSAAEDLGASQPAMQATLTACLVGLAIGQIVVGPLSDSIGRRRPMIAGMALFIVSSLLCAVAPSVYLLDAARLLQGLAGAAGIVLSLAIVRDLFHGVAAARMIAALMAVSGVAPIVAPLAGAQLLRVLDWRGLFVVLAVLGVALLAVAALLVPETLPTADRRPSGWRAVGAGYYSLARDRRFVALTATSGLAFAVMFAYISTSSFVFQDHYGFTATQFSVVFAANAVGLLVTNLIGGRLVGRVSTSVLVWTGLAGMALGSCVAVLALSADLLPLLVGSLFLAVSSLGLVMPTVAALALEDHGALAGTASAALGSARFVFGGLAALVAGIGGNPTVLGVVMVVCAVGALMAFVAAKRAPTAAR
ncbi:Drug resistance transporter, Bcr/CflA subfamily OS=Tsukamurella paurometabola (strain ATCC 8368 /DSM / CCUG 35730 / CIP 100753 / JCM 10117 / KCTC 9821/ NBRC 16120 / NCIMB 702349 / NCTC 13040) OX=521096 GN=Tpau_1659 PE=3 SV=1 [Tsukamurella paurometabola]|uniref:Drug resistance transporter, Bcr/CflA subfamily n=1 Tax=Tsukamurella paurometabola (strain ATCC 8368 / DSM 20162 / CCUG 35730 / CIP 100753 / JCM 10117 / KCTC 9821 / NBRC 16120 / NCIMB 702349 / NCTC 13040) TaxID=521096 RepID=D5UYH2_TSUPD|nr:multidrug effflux MFS transporter [Tsukamurella paurometabola]ADG78279.1 drug resistance transporter, Bcr/CflA subfamily [Tsukamurella paurometabola DSM 20162]SUP31006.1 Sulfonamide resistance protein [Tsukamurella paurometabola]